MLSRKLLYVIIFLACAFTLAIIWWILPSRPLYKAATFTVGLAISPPPPMTKPELLLDFAAGGTVTFHGSYWHPQTIYLFIRGDISRDIVINNPDPLSDLWHYTDVFPPGNYTAQIYIVDTLGRTSPYSDLVYFQILGPPGGEITPPGPPQPPIIPPGKEIKREEAPLGPESIWEIILKRILQALNQNKIIPILTIAITAILSLLNLILSILAMIATQLSLRALILLLINYFLAFFRHEKGDKRGIVFDRETGQPVEGALVSVFRVPEMRQVAAALTDEDGSFYFVVDRGSYAVTVKKAGYLFPARINRQVAQYRDLYIGQTIRINDQSGVINVKIPIEVHAVSLVRRGTMYYLARLYRLADISRVVLLIVGSLAAVLVLIYFPTLINYLLAGSYIIIWIFEYRIVSNKIRFSRVLDARDKRSIDLALVRTIAPSGKLTQTYVTDILGRFLPYVPGPNFRVSIEKPRYTSLQFHPESKRLIEGKKFYLKKTKAQNPPVSTEAKPRRKLWILDF